MKIELKILGNKIEFGIPIGSSLEDLKKWDDILYKVLMYAFYNKPVHLITLSPYEQSWGYELDNPVKIKSKKETVLVNFIPNCSETILKDIISIEEFERGLLRIITIEPSKVQDIIGNDFFKLVTNIDNINIDYELITRESDGRYLYWFNPHLPINEVGAKLKEIIKAFI